VRLRKLLEKKDRKRETQNEGLIGSECSFSATSKQKQKPAVFTERKVER
jgi:hypothetical protein